MAARFPGGDLPFFKKTCEAMHLLNILFMQRGVGRVSSHTMLSENLEVCHDTGIVS